MPDRLQVFAGRSHPALARAIANHLGVRLGGAIVGEYRNGETRVCIEESVRGADVFIVQPTCHPVNDNLMELLIMIDAIRRASASRITAVIPYYGYAKQEKKSRPREPITAKLVADLLQVAGADRILTCDLHAPAIEGFFDIPVDHLQGRRLLADRCRELDLPDPVVVAPDAGRVGWAVEMRDSLEDAELAIIAKQRPTADKAYAVEMVGDVRGKTALLIDDMIMTGGTLVAAAEMLLDRGASAVYACATHAAFAPGTRELLENSPFTRVLVTDTIPLSEDSRYDEDSKLEVISIAPLFGEAILHIHEDRSVSALFRR